MEDQMAVRKAQPMTELLESLRSFVSRYSLASDPYLRGLIDSIESKKSLHIYAELNPLDYLPHPAAQGGLSVMRKVRLLAVIRNVLVFAPVALTWAAVGAATTGFSKYIAANGADVVNFLDFWQNGYDILGNEWKIGNVARLDFVIVLAVIILTLYVSQAGHKSEDLREAEEARIDLERIALALEIQTHLHDKKKITAVTMNASLAGAIARLVTATNNLEDASKIIEKATRKLPKNTLTNSPAPSFLDSFSFDQPLDKPTSRKSRRA
jgi:hypothetical protein